MKSARWLGAGDGYGSLVDLDVSKRASVEAPINESGRRQASPNCTEHNMLPKARRSVMPSRVVNYSPGDAQRTTMWRSTVQNATRGRTTSPPRSKPLSSNVFIASLKAEYMDLSIRSALPEELDGPHTDPADYQQCISELALINRLTLTHRPTLQWLAQSARGLTEFSFLDVGYGGGDLLRAIARWADKRDVKVHLSGIDLNPRSAQRRRAVLRRRAWISTT